MECSLTGPEIRSETLLLPRKQLWAVDEATEAGLALPEGLANRLRGSTNKDRAGPNFRFEIRTEYLRCSL